MFSSEERRGKRKNVKGGGGIKKEEKLGEKKEWNGKQCKKGKRCTQSAVKDGK